MRLYQLTVSKDNVWNVINQFGDIGLAQFIDLNKDEPVFHLPYTKQIKDCEIAERKLQFLKDQCGKCYITLTPPANIDVFLQQIKNIKTDKRKAINLLLDEIMQDIDSSDEFVKSQLKTLHEAEEELEALSNRLRVLERAKTLIPEI